MSFTLNQSERFDSETEEHSASETKPKLTNLSAKKLIKFIICINGVRTRFIIQVTDRGTFYETESESGNAAGAVLCR